MEKFSNQLLERIVELDGLFYTIYIRRAITQSITSPRLVIVSYQPNKIAQQLLRVCINVVQQYTPEPHELWVVDNNSPIGKFEWLLDLPAINLILNRTTPIPPPGRGFFQQIVNRFAGDFVQQKWGSYANAAALELAVQVIDPQSHYLMTLHMDSMPCREGWLSFLHSKLTDTIGAAGVRLDKVRTPEGVLHILGCLINFQLFRKFNLNFWPHLPQYDVGDRITITLRSAGYDIFSCRNTLWEPDLVETIPMSSPFRFLHVDRAFDDEGNVIFLHLGRGIKKSSGGHNRGITPEAWLEFANTHLLF